MSTTTARTDQTVGVQTSSRLDLPATFAHAVGDRFDAINQTVQVGYVALWVGGHTGVRLSIPAHACRDLAALLLTVGAQVQNVPLDESGDTVELATVAFADFPAVSS